MVLVHATKGGLGFGTFVVGGAEVESKDWLVEKILLDHVVEGRWNGVDADTVVAKAQDAVEATKGESKTWLRRRFGEKLVFNL